MRVTVDTNVLIRAVVLDDSEQAKKAAWILAHAEVVAVAMPCLCEFVWVLLRVYKFSSSDVAMAVRALVATANVEVNRPAVDSGLAVLDAGGDFADGVIAFEGRWLGGSTFVSFDKNAVAILAGQGQSVKLL